MKTFFNLASVFFLLAIGARGDMTAPSFTMRPPPASAQPSATADARITTAQRALTQAQAALARVTGADSDRNLARTRAGVNQALADAAAALAWLKSHPADNSLPKGPAPAEALKVHPLSIHTDSPPSLNLLTALEGLNVALNQLLNNPAPDYRGPVLGSLGGFREKIMDDIGAADAALFVHINAAETAAQAAADAARAAQQQAEVEKDGAPGKAQDGSAPPSAMLPAAP